MLKQIIREVAVPKLKDVIAREMGMGEGDGQSEKERKERLIIIPQ